MIIYLESMCDQLEERAASELRRRLAESPGGAWRLGRLDSVTDLEPGKAIVIGAAGRGGAVDALVAVAGIEADLKWAQQDGYIITNVRHGAGDILLIVGTSPVASLHGAMRAAILAGSRFYVSRSVEREDPMTAAFQDAAVPWSDVRLVERPKFAVRGALPWFNFLSGPTAWDQEDWAAYIDNLARSRANMLGFHVYTGGLERYYTYVEPFLRVEADGVLPEAELDTTATARWGYRPMATSRFIAGSHLFYEGDVFGSEAALPRGDLESRYQRAEELLRFVMARAKGWGIRTFLGFEAGIVPPEVNSLVPPEARVPGGELDPFHPAAIKIFHDLLKRTVETYPDLDAIWLFQHEHVMFSGGGIDRHSELSAFCQTHDEAFANLPEEMRWKGPWLLAWIQRAWEWKERHAPHLRIAVSGWGGGYQFPRLLPGLHETLPSDVILTLLVPDQGAGELPKELQALKGRECWAVPWWEGDSFLWHPQPRVASLLRQQAMLADYGFAGSIGLHWRTRDIEANAWAFFESGWEQKDSPPLEAGSLYRDYVASGWGVEEPEIAQRLEQAEKEQWFRIASPEFFGFTYAWGQIEPDKREKIQGLLDRLVEIEENRMRTEGEQPHREREALTHTIATLRFVLLLDSWTRRMQEADEAYERGEYEAAWHLMGQAPVLDVMRAFMARVTTRGELGVLASINQRAWQTYRELYGRIAAKVDITTAARAATPTLPYPQVSVTLPVRNHWQPGDTHATWRVITGSLNVAAVFLKVIDGTGAWRRLQFAQTGTGAYRLQLRKCDLAPLAVDSPLETVVEIATLSGDVITPVGGRAIITV